MTLREWCAYTSNVLYGRTMITIYRKGERPYKGLAGCIPDGIAKRPVEFVTIKKVNPETLVCWEVEVKLDD